MRQTLSGPSAKAALFVLVFVGKLLQFGKDVTVVSLWMALCSDDELCAFWLIFQHIENCMCNVQCACAA